MSLYLGNKKICPIVQKGTPTPSAVGKWEPNPTWWDVDKVLEEDTEDVMDGGKAIFLLADNSISTTLTISPYFFKVVTSDGAVYTTDTIHTWDKTKDKLSNLGYNTRYIIAYTNNATAKDYSLFAKDTLRFNLLYCIFQTLNLSKIEIGGWNGEAIPTRLQHMKLKNCIISTNSLGNSFAKIFSLYKFDIPLNNTNINNLSGAFTDCYNLVEIEFYGRENFITAEINIQYSPVSHQSMINCIKALTSGKKFTVGANNYKLLTDEDKLMASEKSITIVG